MSGLKIPRQVTPIMDKINKDFRLIKLKDIGDFRKGKGIANKDLIEKGYPCITYGQLYTSYDGRIKEINTFINEKTKKKSVKVKYGEILFPSSGETLDEIGKPSVNLLNEIYAGGDIIVFSPNKNVIPSFLSYVLNSEIFTVQSRRFGQGHSVVHIYIDDLREVIVPLPSLDQQKKITRILSTWDHAINLKKEEINFNKIYYENKMKKLISNKTQSLSANTVLGELLEDKNEKVGNRSIEPVAVGVNGIRKRSEIYDKALSNDYSNNKVLRYNWICFGLGTNKLVYDVLLEDNIYSVSPAYNTFKIHNCDPFYLKMYLDTYNKKLSHKFMIISSRQGKSIEMKGLLKEKIHLPNLHFQTQVSNYFKLSRKKLDILQRQLYLLEEEKKGLMQQLLTGKVRVQT